MDNTRKYPWWIAPIAVFVLAFAGETVGGAIMPGIIRDCARPAYVLLCAVLLVAFLVRSFREMAPKQASIRGFVTGCCFMLAVGEGYMLGIALLGHRLGAPSDAETNSLAYQIVFVITPLMALAGGVVVGVVSALVGWLGRKRHREAPNDDQRLA